jgi:hypothetical protein
LESLRQVEAQSNIGNTPRLERKWETALNDLLYAPNRLHEMFIRRNASLLWIHDLGNKVVFVILRPSQCQVAVSGPELMRALQNLSQKTEEAITAWATDIDITRCLTRTTENSRLESMVADMLLIQRKAIADTLIQPAGKRVFDLLPRLVKELLMDFDTTVFLAPCGKTVNFPFELIYLDAEWRRSSELPYLGLRVLMPRVHGLTEMEEVTRRHPNTTRPVKALVVGEPELDGSQVVTKLWGRPHHGFTLLPKGKALAHDRTKAKILQTLADPELSLWVQIGHGERIKEDGAVIEFLRLSNEERILPQDLTNVSNLLQGTAVYHDCCITGRARSSGGGRFEGFPTAVLKAGASCLLTSNYPLWDDAATRFSLQFYSHVLSTSPARDLGAALMQTRRDIFTEFGGNLLVWASLVPWGNPWVRLSGTAEAQAEAQTDVQ